MPITDKGYGTEVNVALLRGINVGGKNKLPMKDLAAMFVDAGCIDVRTYIQSGNVLYKPGQAPRDEIPSLISSSIRERFGLEVPVVTRTAREIKGDSKGQPLPGTGLPAGRPACGLPGGHA